MRFNKIINKLLEEFDAYSDKHSYHPGSEFYSLKVYYTGNGHVTNFERVPEDWYGDWSDNPHQDSRIHYEGTDFNEALKIACSLFSDLCNENIDVDVITKQIITNIGNFRDNTGVWIVSFDESSIKIAFDKESETTKRKTQYEGEIKVGWVVKAQYDWDEETLAVEPTRKLTNQEHAIYDQFKVATEEFDAQYDIMVFYVGDSAEQAYQIFGWELKNLCDTLNQDHIIERALRDARKLTHLQGIFQVILHQDNSLSFIANVDGVALRSQEINKDLESADTTGFEDLL